MAYILELYSSVGVMYEHLSEVCHRLHHFS